MPCTVSVLGVLRIIHADKALSYNEYGTRVRLETRVLQRYLSCTEGNSSLS